jgi:hypothetical protein
MGKLTARRFKRVMHFGRRIVFINQGEIEIKTAIGITLMKAIRAVTFC